MNHSHVMFSLQYHERIVNKRLGYGEKIIDYTNKIINAMLKEFRTLLQLVLFTIAGLGVSSCGEKTETDNPNSTNSKVAGSKWTSTNWDYGIGDDWVTLFDENINIYFHSTTDGLIYYARKDYDSDNGTSCSKEVAHFTYQVVGNDILLDYITDRVLDIYRITLNGNSISANGIDYMKGSINMSEKEWLNTLFGTTGSCKWYHNLKGKMWITGKGEMQNYTSFSTTPWAKNNRHVSQVEVEDGVTSIGAYAFSYPSIGQVDLPSSITEIGEFAFAGSSISTIKLADNIKKISGGAFLGCSYLASIYMPKNIEDIDDGAFSGCKSASLYDTKKLRRIGDNALGSCKITRWTDSEVLEHIGNTAVTYFPSSELVLPNSLKTMGHLAFGDDGISIIRIGKGIENFNGTPFAVSQSGKMYVNKNVPIAVDREIMCDPSIVKKWTLYVPKGSKTAYSKAPYWKNFGSIVEDSSLDGDGTIVEDEGQDRGEENPVYTGTIQGHEYVDLGLSVKWATCNVGALTPYENGEYYCWGRISTDWDTPHITSYTPNDICGDKTYDVATKTWGNKWKMPNKEQVEELIENCTIKKKDNNTVQVTSKINGQSIYFPLTGYYEGFYERGDTQFNLENKGKYGYYMIGEIFGNENREAKTYVFKISTSNTWCTDYFSLSTAIFSYSKKYVIRPVTSE